MYVKEAMISSLSYNKIMDQVYAKAAIKELYNISQLFIDNNIKHWLDWGTVLHAYRDKKLKVEGNDLDLGVLRQDYDKVLKVFQENGIQYNQFVVMADWPKVPVPRWYWKAHVDQPGARDHNKAFMRILEKQDTPWLKNAFNHVDLYFWEMNPTYLTLSDMILQRNYVQYQEEIDTISRSDLFCWFCDPWKSNKYYRRTKKYFIEELDTIDLYGYQFPIPRYIERFLTSRYGSSWQIDRTEKEHSEYTKSGCEYEDMLKEDNITVFIEGVWDLFHQGHVELLKRAHDIYDRVVVGVASDDLATSYKRQPIISYDDRVKMLEACKYVDEIYHNAPCQNITEKVLDKSGADYGLHSVEDPNNWKAELSEAGYDQSLIDSGRAHFLSYTSYHSSDIIDKILSDQP